MELVNFLEDILKITKIEEIHILSNNIDGTLKEEIGVLIRDDDLVLLLRF